MKKTSRWKRFIGNQWVWIILFALFSIIATFQAFNPTSSPPEDGAIVYKDYNNYVIFTQSFEHLQEGKNLYTAYPDEYWDLYKYTPTFAVFFGIFASFPDVIGLGLWNALNALLVVIALFTLPGIKNEHKGLILILLMVEMVTSVQNEQSNGIMTGLLVLGYVLLEKRNYALATLLIVCSVYIKLFGILALVLYLFYPKKWKLALYTALWTTALFLVPLLMVDLEQYLFLWEQFGDMLLNDHTESYGYSVMGIINSWFGIEVNKNWIVLIGAAIFMLPFIQFKAYTQARFRLLAVASILIWIVIFNHKAESPTFVIAMAGVGVWYILSQRKWQQTVVVIFAFVFTSLSATDVFPPIVREEFIKPYAIKAVPAIMVWCLVIYEMMRYSAKKDIRLTEASCE